MRRSAFPALSNLTRVLLTIENVYNNTAAYNRCRGTQQLSFKQEKYRNIKYIRCLEDGC